MERLYEIIQKAQKIEESDKTNLEKVKALFELQKQASSETWSEDKEYSLKANDVYYFVQIKWNRIYDELNSEEKKEADKVINNG
jgi:hypothetical protein